MYYHFESNEYKDVNYVLKHFGYWRIRSSAGSYDSITVSVRNALIFIDNSVINLDYATQSIQQIYIYIPFLLVARLKKT